MESDQPKDVHSIDPSQPVKVDEVPPYLRKSVIPTRYRRIEDRVYPISRRERRRRAREARKRSGKDTPFKELWNSLVEQGGYVKEVE